METNLSASYVETERFINKKKSSPSNAFCMHFADFLISIILNYSNFNQLHKCLVSSQKCHEI